MRVHIPDHPSRMRKALLAPATLLYAIGSALHRAWPRPPHEAPALPLIVIGSLRAGGAGKTPVTLALARHVSAQGFRTGILTYALPRRSHKTRAGGNTERSSGLREVFPDSDWRETSDEAVLLARSLRAERVRVFVTRDRARAHAALARTGAFDVLVSDDGLMDARLRDRPRRDTSAARPSTARRVLRVVLSRRGERPGLWDLLPAGPWRLTAAALPDTDVVLREGEDYTRTLLPPPRWPSPPPPFWVLTGLGNPRRFVRALDEAGIPVRGLTRGADHDLPDLERARWEARRAGTEHFLCTAKDWIKLEAHPHRPRFLHRMDETVCLHPPFLARVASFLGPPTS